MDELEEKIEKLLNSNSILYYTKSNQVFKTIDKAKLIDFISFNHEKYNISIYTTLLFVNEFEKIIQDYFEYMNQPIRKQYKLYSFISMDTDGSTEHVYIIQRRINEGKWKTMFSVPDKYTGNKYLENPIEIEIYKNKINNQFKLTLSLIGIALLTLYFFS